MTRPTQFCWLCEDKSSIYLNFRHMKAIEIKLREKSFDNLNMKRIFNNIIGHTSASCFSFKVQTSDGFRLINAQFDRLCKYSSWNFWSLYPYNSEPNHWHTFWLIATSKVQIQLTNRSSVKQQEGTTILINHESSINRAISKFATTGSPIACPTAV